MKEKSVRSRFLFMTGKKTALSVQNMPLFKRKNSKEQASPLFKLNGRDLFILVGQCILCDLLLAETFYKSATGFFLCIPVSCAYGYYVRYRMREKKREGLEKQFHDLMVAITSSMQAGYALVNALQDAVMVITGLYGNDCLVAKLMKDVIEGNEMNLSLNHLLSAMAKKSDQEEIRTFSEVVIITRQYGGNMPHMIKELADLMEDRMEIKAEILSATTAVRYEAYVMDLIPIAIIWYLNLTGAGFLEILYGTAFGFAFMTGCMFVYAAIVFWQFYMMERAIC